MSQSTFFLPMDPVHLLEYNNVNHDPFTATFDPNFYYSYLAHFPEECFVEEIGGRIRGYMIGKDEGLRSRCEYHVHVSAVTVAPECRKQHLAAKLMRQLEAVGNVYSCQFCDLFVKEKNDSANEFYRKLGYTIYRKIRKYYGDEDGYDDRKPLEADPNGESVQNSGQVITKWVDYEW